MKCIANITDPRDVHRVSDTQASDLVGSGDYRYISKSEYKDGRAQPKKKKRKKS